MHPEQQARRDWLTARNLKDSYSNLKAEVVKEGQVVYKQRSRTDKVDSSQAVRVKIDDGIWAVGEYRNSKFKTLRAKRGKKGDVCPLSQPIEETLSKKDE